MKNKSETRLSILWFLCFLIVALTVCYYPHPHLIMYYGMSYPEIPRGNTATNPYSYWGREIALAMQAWGCGWLAYLIRHIFDVLSLYSEKVIGVMLFNKICLFCYFTAWCWESYQYHLIFLLDFCFDWYIY